MSLPRTLVSALFCVLVWTTHGQAQTPAATSISAEAAEEALEKAAPPAPPPEPGASPAQPPAAESGTRSLLGAARQLFDDYAPEEIKEQYDFPSYEQWEEFAARLQRALEGGSLEELAAFEPDVRQAVSAFRMLPDYGDYADWLAERLDLIETARLAVENPTPAPRKATQATPAAPNAPASMPDPVVPGPNTAVATGASTLSLPYYDVWLKRLQKRPAPERADELVPLLKVIFTAEGIPAELAWLAEVESSLNPRARSPAGARGLFQLMPVTARSLGLSLVPFDERIHPGKNARAAARYLRKLHGRFESWPLTLAAYNAGETRVAATLKKKRASSFAEIAEALPAETRMYVPKVFATLAVRENLQPSELPPPGAADVSLVPPQLPVPPAVAGIE